MHELFHAISIKNTKMINLLLKKPNCNLNDLYENNENALFYSLKNNSPKAAIILIEHNIDINQLDQEGNTPVHISLKKGYKDLSLLILQKNFQNINKINNYNENILNISIKQKFHNVINKILEYEKLNIDFIDNNKNSILINMIQCMDEKLCINMISKYKVDVNYINSYHFDALILSLLKNYEKLGILLVKKGSNFNFKNNSNFNSIKIAEEMGLQDFLKFVKFKKEEIKNNKLRFEKNKYKNVLFEFISNNNEQLCIDYINKNKINYEILDFENNSLLIKSIKLKMYDLAYLLIKIGSEKFLKQINNEHENALLLSLKNKHYFLALEIIEKKGYDVNLIDKFNCSALLLSIDSGIEDLSLKIFEQNKNIIHVNILFNNDYTLLMYALMNNMFSLSLNILDKINEENLNFSNKKNECALTIIIEKNNKYLLKKILSKKEINIDKLDKNGETILNSLIHIKYFDLIEYILQEKKGNMYIKNVNGENACFLLGKLNKTNLLHYF